MAEAKKPATKAVAKTTPKTPAKPKDVNDNLIQLAIQKDLDVDKLEKLIELKNSQMALECKKDFDLHFSMMQADFQPVVRSKSSDKHNYAPIEGLQKQFGEIISSHGFSYKWGEELVEGEKLRVFIHISGYGHTETSHKDLPSYDGMAGGKQIMNPLQAEGTRSTYGRRYTFKNGFGITEEDEDTDGSFDDGVAYAEYIRKLDEETDPGKIRQLAGNMYRQLKDEKDYRGAEVITKAYNRRKGDL